MGLSPPRTSNHPSSFSAAPLSGFFGGRSGNLKSLLVVADCSELRGKYAGKQGLLVRNENENHQLYPEIYLFGERERERQWCRSCGRTDAGCRLRCALRCGERAALAAGGYLAGLSCGSISQEALISPFPSDD